MTAVGQRHDLWKCDSKVLVLRDVSRDALQLAGAGGTPVPPGAVPCASLAVCPLGEVSGNSCSCHRGRNCMPWTHRCLCLPHIFPYVALPPSAFFSLSFTPLYIVSSLFSHGHLCLVTSLTLPQAYWKSSPGESSPGHVFLG